eukprot:9893752-Alexandrium_andersonii.AAC.1
MPEATPRLAKSVVVVWLGWLEAARQTSPWPSRPLQSSRNRMKRRMTETPGRRRTQTRVLTFIGRGYTGNDTR